MPSGPRRFGCGEIATGFKPGGFPPGFFNPSRIIPRPGGPNNPGGGNGGGPGPGPWKCVETPDSCANRHGPGSVCGRAVTPLDPCITTTKCEEQAPGSCTPGPGGDPHCYESEQDCEDARAQNMTGCKEVDDCGPPSDEYHCVEHATPCTGPAGGYQYRRYCQQCTSNNTPGLPACDGTIYANIGSCQPGCKDEACPPIQTSIGTPFTGTPYSCVEDPSVTTPCNLPGGTGSPGYSTKGVKCLPCNCVMTSAGRVCTPNGVAVGGTPTCPWPVVSPATTCTSHPACRPEECPPVITKYVCYEKSRELCFNQQPEIINKCQTCKCWTDPTTTTEYCYRQAIMGGTPVGPHSVLETGCFADCNDEEDCPDVDFESVFGTQRGNLFL